MLPTWVQALGIRCVVSGVWNLVFGVWCVWCLVFGVCFSVFGAWFLVFGDQADLHLHHLGAPVDAPHLLQLCV
jgi:hypothetical protein